MEAILVKWNLVMSHSNNLEIKKIILKLKNNLQKNMKKIIIFNVLLTKLCYIELKVNKLIDIKVLKLLSIQIITIINNNYHWNSKNKIKKIFL